MRKITAILPRNAKPAPLWNGNPDDHEPYPVMMELTSAGSLIFAVNYDGTYSWPVHRGTSHVWTIPAELTRKEIGSLVREVRPLLRQVLKGLWTKYNYNDHEWYGSLSPSAEEAKVSIKAICEKLFEDVADHCIGVDVLDTGEFFAADTLEDYRLSTASSDGEIRSAAERLEKSLFRSNRMLDTDVLHSMRSWVDDMRSR